jgi:hypothetical protein
MQKNRHHKPAHHVQRLWVVAEEVCDAPALLDVVLGIGLQAVHHVGELHAVTDEEHLQQEGFKRQSATHFEVKESWCEACAQ